MGNKLVFTRRFRLAEDDGGKFGKDVSGIIMPMTRHAMDRNPISDSALHQKTSTNATERLLETNGHKMPCKPKAYIPPSSLEVRLRIFDCKPRVFYNGDFFSD